MSLPSTIATGQIWPFYKNSVVGPFQSGTSLYAILTDKTANKLRCYTSADEGHTWAEADSTNAPASSTSTTFWHGAHVVQDGTNLYASQPLTGGTSANIVPFACATNTWGTAITGPATITVDAGDQVVPLYGLRRSDGSFVLVYNGPTETVMGTARTRIKIHIRSSGGTWTGPFDVVGSANSPIANTLPGDAVNYYLRAAIVGVSDRVLIFYSTNVGSDTVKCRVLTSADAFVTAADIAGTNTGHSIAYPVGQPATYTDGALTKVALPVRETAGGWSIEIARCDTATAETAANWSTETAVVGIPEVVDCNMATVTTDGKKLWLWYAPDNLRSLRYTDDAAAATWSDTKPFKSGNDVIVGGFSARHLSASTLGVVYLDELGTSDIAQTLSDQDHRIGYSDTGGENRAWQKFRTTGAVDLRYARVLLRRVGTPGTLALRIYTDSAGSPSGTQVGVEGNILAANIGTTDEWQNVAFTGTSLSASTDYWLLVISGDGSTNSTSDYYVARINSADVYADGHFGTGTAAGGFTAVTGKDLAFQMHTSASPVLARYDRLDIYTPKAAVGVGSTETIVDLGETPPAYYDVNVDLGDNADPAGTVTVYVDGGWDTGALNPITTDGPNSVQAQNSITINSPPRHLRITTVVESSTSVIGVAGV